MKNGQVWDEAEGKPKRYMRGHTGDITHFQNLENGFLVSCSKDKTIKIWNQLTG